MYKSMALHHVLLIFIIIVLWTNIVSVQARRGEEVAREYRRGEDMKERRTRKFDEMVLSTARGYGKRAGGQLRKDFLLEWIAMERMRDLGYPRYAMSNAELTPE